MADCWRGLVCRDDRDEVLAMEGLSCYVRGADRPRRRCLPPTPFDGDVATLAGSQHDGQPGSR